MKRFIWALAAAGALVPAALGLLGNHSLAQSVPVPVPSRAEVVTSTPSPAPSEHRTASPSATADDHGGATASSDDPAGDDHGGATASSDDPAGDDHGGQRTSSTAPASDDSGSGGSGHGDSDDSGTGRPLIPTDATTPAGATAFDAVAPSRLPTFVSLTASDELRQPERKAPSLRRIIVALTLIALVLVAVVLVGATLAASRLADREAVNDAANTANLLANSVVIPALSDELLTSQPAAVARMDQAVRRSVLPNGIVRVKLWRPDGTIVYSDDPRLIGRNFALDDEQRAALASPQTRAHVSTLDRSENEFEQFEGKLVEVYRPVWTPSGRQLLFEVYGEYQPVLTRASDCAGRSPDS